MLQYKQQLNLSNICPPFRKTVMYHAFQYSCNAFYVTKKKLEGGYHDNDEGWRRRKMTCRNREKVCELVRVGL